MTAVMLATYPEVFAAGGIIAGLPYRAATNVQEAFDGMFQCAPRPARAWGDLVRAASRIAGRGRASRCGMATPMSRSSPRTPARSSSNGATCTASLRP